MRLRLPATMLWLFAATPAGADQGGDLGAQVRGSQDICSAVRILKQTRLDASIATHALHRTAAGTTANPHASMTDRAWNEAGHGEYGMANYPQNEFNVSRVSLDDTLPAAWVFETAVGSLRNPLLWVFSSLADGARADHLLAQLGSEGSGPFDTYFVRFAQQSFAITRAVGESGSDLEVYRLDPAKLICALPPP